MVDVGVLRKRVGLPVVAARRQNLLATAGAITVPTAVVNAGRDRDVYPEAHSKAIFRALATQDKAYFDFPDRLHYFEPNEGEDPARPVREQMGKVIPWLRERCPA